MKHKTPCGTRVIVCNTGTTRASHLRLEGSGTTICGRHVYTTNRGEQDLPTSHATCKRCKQILPEWVPDA